MKPGIHPAYEEVNVTCACGHKFRTRSAHKGDIRVEICSSCHPFFTGKQKLIDTEGRVDRFQKKYQKVRDAAEAKAPSEEETAGRVKAVKAGMRQPGNLRPKRRRRSLSALLAVAPPLPFFHDLLPFGLLAGREQFADFLPLILADLLHLRLELVPAHRGTARGSRP